MKNSILVAIKDHYYFLKKVCSKSNFKNILITQPMPIWTKFCPNIYIRVPVMKLFLIKKSIKFSKIIQPCMVLQC